jgi:hypothetical protein
MFFALGVSAAAAAGAADSSVGCTLCSCTERVQMC